MLVGLCSTALADHNTIELVSTGPAGGNQPLDASFGGISTDSSRVFFSTAESLVSADADGGLSDVYERSGGQTMLLSTPSAGDSETPGLQGAFFTGATASGSRVFFETDDRLSPADTDAEFDVYERSGGATTLISPAALDSTGVFAPAFEGISETGDVVFFSTDEKLVDQDTDGNYVDIYKRSGGVTTLVSDDDALTPDGAFDVSFDGASALGDRVAFETGEQLTAGDTDASIDLYERSGATPTLVSTGPTGGNGAFDASYGTISDDGSRIIFDTRDPLAAEDGDSTPFVAYRDVYERRLGASPTTTLLSESTAGPDGPFDAFFVGASNDATRVFFDTDEDITGEPTDFGGLDIYRRYSGSTLNVSGGTGFFNARFLANTNDGLQVFFDTAESLAAEDGDALRDVYSRSGVTAPTLVSGGGSEPVDVCAVPSAAVPCGLFFSADGSRVFINTDAAVLPGDVDSDFDIYERSGGVTTMVTGSGAPLPVIMRSASSDGSLVFFETRESIAGDADGGAQDVFRAFHVALPPTAPSAQPSAGGSQGGGTVVSLSATASAARTQRILEQGGVIVLVLCNKPCDATATGSVSVPGASKVFRLKRAKRSVKANKRTQLRLRLAGKARKAVSRALKRKKKLRAKISLTITDSAGARRTSRLTVKLKR